MSKPRAYLFVDGYNVINDWPELIACMEDLGLDAARAQLIDYMAEYQELSGEQVILVFDAHLVKGGWGTKEVQKGVQVVYTMEHETADARIERKAAELGRLDQITVASSDLLVQQVILQKGAVRMSAQELRIRFEQMKGHLRRKMKKKEALTKPARFSVEDLLADRLDQLAKILEEGEES